MIELFIATNNTGTLTRTAYWQGFDAYCDRQPLEDMPTEDHKRGWWFACRCEGDTLAYVDEIEEREFIRWGGA